MGTAAGCPMGPRGGGGQGLGRGGYPFFLRLRRGLGLILILTLLKANWVTRETACLLQPPSGGLYYVVVMGRREVNFRGEGLFAR